MILKWPLLGGVVFWRWCAPKNLGYHRFQGWWTKTWQKWSLPAVTGQRIKVTWQIFFQCRPGVRSQNVINPELKTLIGCGQFFSTHQGCSLLLRIHTTAEKDKMRRRFTYWKLQGYLYTHKNKHWIHQKTTLQMMVWKIHLLSTERICLQLWRPATATHRAIFLEFFQLGHRGWELPGIPLGGTTLPNPQKMGGWDFLSLCFCKNSGGDEHMLGRVWSPRYSLKISWLIQRSLPIFILARKSSWCIISLTKSSALQFWIHCLELVTWNIKSSEKDNLDTKSTLSSKCSTPN